MRIKNIDTSTTAGKIAVMQACEAGEKIVVKVAGSGGRWVGLTKPNPDWDWHNTDYAVVEKPREIWVNFYKTVIVAHTSKEEADLSADPHRLGPAVKFVEVME